VLSSSRGVGRAQRRLRSEASIMANGETSSWATTVRGAREPKRELEYLRRSVSLPKGQLQSSKPDIGPVHREREGLKIWPNSAGSRCPLAF
jgi:hypothetical protein